MAAPTRDIVVIGGSAGGLEALSGVASRLPGDLAAAVLVVIHTSREQPGLLAQLISRVGKLPAAFAKHGQRIRHGEIVIAPPDAHLLVDGSRLRLTHGPRENGFRPAIDPLFRTAAASYGPRVIGVVLSGALDDGTRGLFEIKRMGGLTLVQQAEEAAFPSMPLSAMRSVEIDKVLPVEEIADTIAASAGRGQREPAFPPRVTPLRDTAEGGGYGLREGINGLPASGITCPECGGALWDVAEGRLLSFRCHVGHTYGDSSLLAHQASEVEAALWTALRALEEAVALRQRMASHAIESGLDGLARAYANGAAAAQQKADQIRHVLTHPDPELSNGAADLGAASADSGEREGRGEGPPPQRGRLDSISGVDGE
jgi:two-component system chemotaxis response regulator CheB